MASKPKSDANNLDTTKESHNVLPLSEKIRTGKITIYVGFSTIYGFQHPLATLECIYHRQWGMTIYNVFITLESLAKYCLCLRMVYFSRFLILLSGTGESRPAIVSTPL